MTDPERVAGARRLPACPSSPNCVNSEEGSTAPLLWTGTAGEAIARLTAWVDTMPRARVVETGDDFLRAEFRSLVFRFVDDMHCVVDTDAQRVHLRSASRVGRSDFGVNARRMEALRAWWSDRPHPGVADPAVRPVGSAGP